jgi:hypothetical protein
MNGGNGRGVLGQLRDGTVYCMEAVCRYRFVKRSEILNHNETETESLSQTVLGAFA